MPKPVIRMAQREDGPAFVALVRALAEFEQLPGPDDAAAARLCAHAFDEPRKFELLVAEDDDGAIVAYAVFFPNYSTFRARPSLYLEDLFVHPRARRHGLGRAMLAHLRALAEARGCGRFEWMVLDWNEDAKKLYEGIGAKRIDGWQLYRIDLPGGPE
jgi:GNAT superfamily N-acetyltransferase